MTNPDQVIDASGEEVTPRWIEEPVFDEYDNLDRDASEIEEEPIKAILSNPTEEDLELLSGRSASASLAATVESSNDIRTDREGFPDEIDARGRTFRVIEIIDDRNPFVRNLRKKRLLLDHQPAENRLSEA